MKYSISYQVSTDEKQHIRYYNALDKRTALEMFKATCEESLVGEQPVVVKVKKIKKQNNS